MRAASGRLNGKLQDFSIITNEKGSRAAHFQSSGASITHTSETALQKSDHAFVCGGRTKIAILTGPNGENVSFGIEKANRPPQRHIQAVEKFTISRGAKKCAVAEMEAVNYMRVKSVHADVEVYFSCKQNPAKTLKGA